MKSGFIIGILIFGTSLLHAQRTTNEEYIERFKAIAMEEMRQHKIPASITLAQGILESGAGNSRLSKEGNAHFGIKCKKNWTGKTIIEDDDERNECFRAYDAPEDSYRDHSLFLRENVRYAFLFELSILDYKGWAEGLRKAGYATNQRYPQMLIGLIERYNLAQYDSLVFYGSDASTYAFDKVRKPNIDVVDNNIPLTVAGENDDVKSLAEKNQVREWQIYKYNDLPKDARIEPGMIIYLKPKKRKAAVPNHIVQPGETMWEISQKYGIKMKQLNKKNKLDEGEQVVAGQEINLRKKRSDAPQTGDNPPQKDEEAPTPLSNVNRGESAQKNVQVSQPVIQQDNTEIKPKHYPDTNEYESSNTQIEVNNNSLEQARYIVLAGETLYGISRKLQVNMQDLQKWNKLHDNNIKVGDTLIYFTQKASNTTKEVKHVVVPGETLYSISRKYEVTVEQIKSLNKLETHELKIGQVLIVEVKAP
jgi:LysM repeat protein